MGDKEIGNQRVNGYTFGTCGGQVGLLDLLRKIDGNCHPLFPTLRLSPTNSRMVAVSPRGAVSAPGQYGVIGG